MPKYSLTRQKRRAIHGTSDESEGYQCQRFLNWKFFRWRSQGSHGLTFGTRLRRFSESGIYDCRSFPRPVNLLAERDLERDLCVWTVRHQRPETAELVELLEGWRTSQDVRGRKRVGVRKDSLNEN